MLCQRSLHLKLLTLFVAACLFCGLLVAQSSAPIPPGYQDLYNELSGYLQSFQTTLNSNWNGGKSFPVAFAAQLPGANANVGPSVSDPANYSSVLMQVDSLKAMGVKAIMISVGFPAVYRPFFSTTAQYQQMVSFYSQLAADVHRRGLKLIVQSQAVYSQGVANSWNAGPYYHSLTWAQYQAGRAQQAATLAQIMNPDYLSVLCEPDTEQTQTGFATVNTVSGATALVSQILAAVKAATPGVPVGAGVGVWHPQYLDMEQSLLTLPLQFFDVHIYPVNNGFLDTRLPAMLQAAQQAGIPLASTQVWLSKVRDSELTQLESDTVNARNVFSFWEPLDQQFLKELVSFAYWGRLSFLTPFWTNYFQADLPWTPTLDTQSPGQLLGTANAQAGLAMYQGAYAPDGIAYGAAIRTVPDTTPPSAPANLVAGASSSSIINVLWSASTDNVGVVGYYVYRNGTRVGQTAQLNFSDSGLSSTTTYNYAVLAYDFSGNVSAPVTVSCQTRDTVAPSAPGSLLAKAVSSTQIQLNWSAATDDSGKIAAYYIFGGSSPANLTQLATTAGTTLTWNQYSLTPGTAYYYAVQALDGSANTGAPFRHCRRKDHAAARSSLFDPGGGNLGHADSGHLVARNRQWRRRGLLGVRRNLACRVDPDWRRDERDLQLHRSESHHSSCLLLRRPDIRWAQ